MRRTFHRPARRTAIAAALLALAACAERPSRADYGAYEAMMRAGGMLRVETAPGDAPYGAAGLARNFERIALRHEADPNRPGGEANWQANPLQRWEGPVRYRLDGSGVTAADRAEVGRLMRRIAALTGLEISAARHEPNFLILITTAGERDRVRAGLARLNPALADTFDLWRRRPQLICVADNLFHPDEDGLLTAALVVIGAETGDLLRRACLHEEIAQAFGLANDHPAVRPSIFNDDGEFALLTAHDEQLLRILYDRRLRRGMTREEAMPIVRRIAAELAPGFSPPFSPGPTRLAASDGAGLPDAD